MNGEKSIPAIRKMITESIRLQGHGVMMVGPTPTDQQFSYSIGLEPTYGFEILCVGLGRAGGLMINRIADQLPDLPLALNTPYPRLALESGLADLPVAFIETFPHLVRKYVVQADIWYDRPVRVVQLVYADRQGRLPWDAGYDQEYMKDFQPLLGERT